MLAHCDQRVYLPQNGFADSLNASVAAALSIHTLLMLYGPLACGDLVEGTSGACAFVRICSVSDPPKPC